jgi:four helix bundle protein
MLIKSHRDLNVYKLAYESALEIFKISKDFPHAEKYSLTDQIRKSSRSVCANLTEAFRKRRYEKHFVLKLSDAEAEAAETQVWLEFSKSHQYISGNILKNLLDQYEHIISMIVKMQNNSKNWTIS